MLSRLVIAFLSRSKHLLIPWLQSPSAVILEPKKGKSVTLSIVSPPICHGVMSLLFYMLSRFVMDFLPRSKSLLISWLQSPSTVILEPKKIKSVTLSTFSLSTCHEVMRLDATILVLWMLFYANFFTLCFLPSSKEFEVYSPSNEESKAVLK